MVKNISKFSKNIINLHKRDNKSSDNNIEKSEEELTNTFLKTYLEDHNIPQADLARAIKRDKVTVNRYVNGIREMSTKEIEKIARFLEIEPADLAFPAEPINPNYILKRGFAIEKNLNKKLKIHTPGRRINQKYNEIILIDNVSMYCHGEIWLVKKIKEKFISNHLCLITTKKEMFTGVPFILPHDEVLIRLSPYYGAKKNRLQILVQDIISCQYVYERFNPKINPSNQISL
tara:strand:- start:110 stop:805 length:696 start_codon:yes stop_codon:yes gene_type:complete